MADGFIPSRPLFDTEGHRQVEFTCTYEFNGKKWGVTLWASTHEEAEMKLRAMGKGVVDGVVGGIVLASDKCPTCGRRIDDR